MTFGPKQNGKKILQERNVKREREKDIESERKTRASG